ncbi:MAG: hypothetical protein KGM47_17795, partial [Acidobacteriota bacterium]|nr:hypothetical protein [Acidobacteriota bacterium]
RGYPPEGRHVAASQIEILRRLPLSFVPLLLQQIRDYDWKFPAEREGIDRQLSYLRSLSPSQLTRAMAGFSQIQLKPQFERLDWVNEPGVFSERLSAYLWSTHQIDAFRQAAISFMDTVDASQPQAPPPAPRLGIAVIGQGVTENKYPLFRKLRAHGVYFSQVKPANGFSILLDAVAARARAHPVRYGHWYIDGGGEAAAPASGLARVSYAKLKPVRTALLNKIHDSILSGIGGPEALRSMLHRMSPQEIGLSDSEQDAVLSYFQTRVLTDGSGTQIFSTTFVQWAAREALRRAEPVTLLAHFSPRQRERPMNELLSGKDQSPEPDPEGSLIDADMGAYLTWVDQQRLSGAEQSAFLVWFENHSEALAIGPAMPHGVASNSPVDLKWLVGQLTES